MAKEGIDEELRRYLEEGEKAEGSDKKTQKEIPTAQESASKAPKPPRESTGFFQLPPELAEPGKKDSEPLVPLVKIEEDVRVLLENPSVEVFPEILQVLEKYQVSDWSESKREQVFNSIIKPLKEKESAASLAAWEEVSEEAKKNGWELGHPERQALINKKLDAVTKQYTEPYFQLYDWLKIKPADDDEDTRRGRTVLD